MAISFGESTHFLLSGKQLSWSASGGVRAGSITLGKPGQRRLFNFLLGASSREVAEGADSLFDGLIAAWKDEESDPTTGFAATGPDDDEGPWYLHKIETTNFGGLNTYGGPAFCMELAGENWCLEGSNGSGKTLLANAIIWTFTGYRVRENDGLDLDGGTRTPVYDDSGRKIGAWPPLVTFPESVADLKGTAKVNVDLVFLSASGNQALARRTLVSEPDGNASVEVLIDPRLTATPQLIEAGLLMPARLAHIGFGSRSASLYDAIKMLTGLDQLADIAQGAAAFSSKGRRFLKYARDRGIGRLESSFRADIAKAKELVPNTELTIPDDFDLGEEMLQERIKSLSDAASDDAKNMLVLLKSDITEDIDLSSIEDRKRLSRAVNGARDIVEKKTKGVPTFAAWAALKSALDDRVISGLTDKLSKFEVRLDTALDWHTKQLADEKLRLKALAARFFLPPEDLTLSATCPLCAQHLETEDQRALARELGELRASADAAERAIDDACSDLEKALYAVLPQKIVDHFAELASMDPAVAYGLAVRARFLTSPPFSDVLVGLARSVEERVAAQEKSLPRFQYPEHNTSGSAEPVPARELRHLIHDVRRVVSLAVWWGTHRGAFVNAWSTLLGEENEAGECPPESLVGMIKKLEEANDRAQPLDRIASHLRDAGETVSEWTKVNTEQEMREAIADALQPMKDLKYLVDAETHRTIESLSGRVGSILEEIRLRERFEFGNAELKKRQVTVQGRFSQDYKIDAGLVANASWLRAVLWAFTFAMRDQAIQEQGWCNLPLVVLDDPQLTFDPKNKRKWAEKIVQMANAKVSDGNGFQLFLTTHERQFFDIVTGTCELEGQKGMIARPHGEAGVAQILNGSKLERLFADAKAEHSDGKGYDYVRAVRVYCEDLLRIILRPESYELTTNTLGSLTDLLKKYRRESIPPFNRPIFAKLTESLKESGNRAVVYMNATNHTDDGTIGLAQAEDVERYWTTKLRKRFSDAFMLAADYDSYASDPRMFSYPETIIEFPRSRAEAIAEASLLKTGIAAAAASDGYVGDGAISIEEWDAAAPVKLHNHDAYQVNASTLEPVVTIGDVLLVKNYGEPNPRNLVVAAHGDSFVARRLNISDEHPGMAVLTGQSTNPYMLPSPIIAPADRLSMRKVVGTVFVSTGSSPGSAIGEVVPMNDTSGVASVLHGARLFRVSGRSMEPIALEEQFVITRREIINEGTLGRLEGSLVIAIDEDGAKYFKRIRQRDELIILESVNSDRWTPSEVLSLRGNGRPALTGLLSVAGVLFEEP